MALLLVLVPLVAALVNVGRWEPQGDDALIELRVRDVGTSRTPLIGQPSTSSSYGAKAANVAHLGPLGFYVVAPGVRILGSVTGTLLSTAAVSAGSMLVVAWLLFRHLGPRGGAAGAILVSLAAFSAGASGLVDPLSSNFGRLPLLAAAVAVWAVLCGDVRVLPLGVGCWSFAAQQHLSVVPASALLAGAAAAGLMWFAFRAGTAARREAARWLAISAAVGLVAWAPVLWQQLTTEPGNLGALARYTGDPQRRDLGLRSAFSQVSNVLGPRPLLGRSSPAGWDLVAHRSTLGVVVTLAVVAAIGGAGGWWQRRDPKLLAALVMVAVAVAAGLLTGSSVPDSPEQGRLNFFHWAFVLSFFEVLVLGWLAARLAPVVAPMVQHGRRSTAVAVAAVVIVGVAITPLAVHRPSDRLVQPVDTRVVRAFLRELRRSKALAEVRGPVLLLVDGDDRFVQLGDTVGSRLSIEGRAVAFAPGATGFVHPDRLADLCSVRRTLVVTPVLRELPEPPGIEIARVDAAPGLDHRAFDRLARRTHGVHTVLGADLDRALDALPGRKGNLTGAVIALRLSSAPESVLLSRGILDLLIDHPPEAPQLDRQDLIDLRASLPARSATVYATELTAHLLDRKELRSFRPELFAAC